MRTLLPLPALLVALALPPRAARAVEPVVALRLGVAGAVGSAAADVPVTDVVPVQLPIQLDVLGRQGPWAIGAYGSAGLGHPGRCGGGASCSAWAARVGVQGTWSPATVRGLAPWVGVATGYEWVSAERTRGGTVTTRYRGLELVAVQGGLEWPVWSHLALGPYALVSVGRYARYAVDTGQERASIRIPDPALHAWFQVGVRGRLLLGGAR